MKVVFCAAPLQHVENSVLSAQVVRQAAPLTRELVLRAICSGWGEWPEKIKAQANVMSAP